MIYLLQHSIERAADHAADHGAFCVPGQGLSYGELVAGSRRLAHLLVEQGVRRGDRVGIYMPRGLETALSVYGVFQAGAAFVPLDPHLPVAALRKLVHDCGIRLLLSHERQRASLQGYVATGDVQIEAVIGLDGGLDDAIRSLPWTALEAFPDAAAPAIRATEDDLAYVMYSSGSTGRPKGIMHTHRSGLAYARLSVDTYGVGRDDRIANHSPLHFDMSTFGYFSAPLAGATTLIVPEAYTKVAASLAQLIEAQGITIWYSVPLALIQLLHKGVIESRDLSRIRWVLFGGEPFPVKHLRKLMTCWPQARFSNVYGPAEVNQCTYYHIPRTDTGAPLLQEDQPLPIGSVWDNTEGMVLDANDQPVTAGEAGELVIRSPTMMRGYWRQPDRNAVAFYRQPLYAGFDRVFYRTGDLVREDAEGQLRFLGRKDRQVKVRGYRVELDDIEHTLALHPDIDEAAVYPVRVDDSVHHIEAAVLTKVGVGTDAEGIETFLTERLSPYAVPDAIHLRGDLPRTTSGKIDRRALQAAAEHATTADDSPCIRQT